TIPTVDNTPVVAAAVQSDQPLAEQPVHSLLPKASEPIAFNNNIGGDGGIKPTLRHTVPMDDFHTAEKTFLQRFEFAVDESFGKEFPNSIVSSAALPLITNLAASGYFQVLPHSNLLWIGRAFGTA